jgi:hypothetical protein
MAPTALATKPSSPPEVVMESPARIQAAQ